MKMSFYNGSLNKKEAKLIIAKSDKPIRYTYGFEYRNPTTNKVLITKEAAYHIIDNECYLDIDFDGNFIHLNAYSDNDMF